MRLLACILGLLVFVPSVSGQDLTEKDVLQKLSSESPRARALAAQVELARASALTEGLRPNGALSLSREAAAGTPETYLLYEQPLSITGRRDYLATSRAGVSGERGHGRAHAVARIAGRRAAGFSRTAARAGADERLRRRKGPP